MKYNFSVNEFYFVPGINVKNVDGTNRQFVIKTQ
jgi:hypothetical protein